jgi:hypothetical protein
MWKYGLSFQLATTEIKSWDESKNHESFISFSLKSVAFHLPLASHSSDFPVELKREKEISVKFD